MAKESEIAGLEAEVERHKQGSPPSAAEEERELALLEKLRVLIDANARLETDKTESLAERKRIEGQLQKLTASLQEERRERTDEKAQLIQLQEAVTHISSLSIEGRRPHLEHAWMSSPERAEHARCTHPQPPFFA